MKKNLLKSFLVFVFIFNSSIIAFSQTTFTIGSNNNVTTATVTLPITVTNFNNIAGIQGSINWDNTKLTYNSITGTNSALSGISFSNSVAGNTGRIGYAWTESNAQGINIANNAVLFNLVLNVVPTATGAVTISFTTTPTDLVVVNGNLDVVNTTYNSGTVNIPVALPTLFGNISAVKVNNAIAVNWQTLAQQNTQSFDVERSTNNVSGFTKIASLLATNINEANYSYIDNNVNAGIIYYRIKAVDNDGKFNYSNIIAYKTGITGIQLQAYPNPVKNNLQVNIVSEVNDEKSLQIFDITGKVVMQKNIQLVNGTVNINLSTEHLIAGTYLLVLKGTDVRPLTFIKN
jgi:hypothetical protein